MRGFKLKCVFYPKLTTLSNYPHKVGIVWLNKKKSPQENTDVSQEIEWEGYNTENTECINKVRMKVNAFR